jgi:transposase-like protein
MMGEEHKMACEEKARLVAEYEETTKKFSASITELQRKMGTSPKAEYDRLQHTVDEARLKSEQARLALDQHVVKHGC